MSWIIRVAEPDDAEVLPEVERSAGMRYRSIPDLAFLADGDDRSVAWHRRHIAQGTEWVALSVTQEIVGFLAAEIIGAELHIWELSVRYDTQNRGIGRRLIESACTFARQQGLRSLTLTTFAYVPWNAPWYQRLGFVHSRDDERLAALVRAESDLGWPGRCAMRKTLESIRVGVDESLEVETFLAERIYDYNSKATGYFDGRHFSSVQRDHSGRIKAAEEYAKSLRCPRMLLATHSFQAPTFYERLGYKKEAVVQDHPPGHANLYFGKWFTVQQ